MYQVLWYVRLYLFEFGGDTCIVKTGMKDTALGGDALLILLTSSHEGMFRPIVLSSIPVQRILFSSIPVQRTLFSSIPVQRPCLSSYQVRQPGLIFIDVLRQPGDWSHL